MYTRYVITRDTLGTHWKHIRNTHICAYTLRHNQSMLGEGYDVLFGTHWNTSGTHWEHIRNTHKVSTAYVSRIHTERERERERKRKSSQEREREREGETDLPRVCWRQVMTSLGTH